jgi:hypothetical protein
MTAKTRKTKDLPVSPGYRSVPCNTAKRRIEASAPLLIRPDLDFSPGVVIAQIVIGRTTNNPSQAPTVKTVVRA